MSDKVHVFLWGGYFGLLVGIMVIGMFLMFQGKLPDQIRQSAVEAGAAEYYLDSENEKRFRWVGCEDE